MAQRQNEERPKAGRCAIVGRPNVGKSTLLNAMLRQKLVIATPRAGTTRTNVLGVFVSESPPVQIAFVDTPGMEKPRTALDRVLADRAQEGLIDCDIVLHVVEPNKASDTPIHSDDLRILERLSSSGATALLAINKIDRVKTKELLLPVIQAFSTAHDYAAVVPVSAKRRLGLDRLVDEIRVQLPDGILYEDDTLTDRPERFFVTELVREAAMHAVRQEVPRGIAITLDRYEERPERVYIDATLIVDKPSHKGIVLGAAGATIKKIGIAARREIEAFIERDVMLKLWVKVVPGWTRDPDKAHRIVREAEEL